MALAAMPGCMIGASFLAWEMGSNYPVGMWGVKKVASGRAKEGSEESQPGDSVPLSHALPAQTAQMA